MKCVRSLSFAAVACAWAAAQDGGIRGRGVDSGDAALGNAVIRVLPQGSASMRYQTRVDSYGAFLLKGIAPGSYTLEIWLPGFRAKFVRNVEVRASQITDVGTVRLDF